MKIHEIDQTNIYIIEDAFDNNLCETLIKYIDADTRELRKIVFGPGSNVESYCVINIEKHIDNMLTDKMRELFKVVTEYAEQITVVGQTLIQLRKVYGRTRLHKDGVFDNPVTLCNFQKIKSIRSLTMVVTLNDDFEGGIYDFPNQKIAFKPKKGTAICFPPYYTHPHSVSHVEQNKYRYICSSWGLDDFLIKSNESENESESENDCQTDCQIQTIWTYKNQKPNNIHKNI